VLSNLQQLPRGYPHQRLVRQALRRLVPRLERGELPAPPERVWKGWRDYEVSDPVLSAQRLARSIADVYRLQVRTIVVSFQADLPVAGRVELGPTADFFVELRSELKSQPRKIAAVLAHEVAHIFLHRRRLEFTEVLDNEVLTDTTALVYGFGALLLDTYQVTETSTPISGGERITRHEEKLGYLSPEEYGWLLHKRGQLGVVEDLSSPAATRAYFDGQRRQELDLGPPLVGAGFWRRMLYRWVRWWIGLRGGHQELRGDRDFALSGGKVAFRCPHCAQSMRLPTHRKLKASCPACGRALRCET
jgi:hypothetical protein